MTSPTESTSVLKRRIADNKVRETELAEQLFALRDVIDADEDRLHEIETAEEEERAEAFDARWNRRYGYV